MNNNNDLSLNNSMFVVRKFNDDYYTATVIKNYSNKQKHFKEFDWMLFGGDFKSAIAVTKTLYNGVYVFADTHGNPLLDSSGNIREYIEYKSIEHSDKKLEQSLSRAKRYIFEISLCNKFEYFVTLTLDPKKVDRFNFNDFKKEWHRFCKSYNKKKKNKNYKIEYLLVPELHPTSGAYHLHGLIKGINPDDFKINEHGYLDFVPFREWFGFCSCSKIKYQNRCARYMTKYITKELGSCIDKGDKCYLCSQGLKRPDILLCSSNAYMGAEYSWQFENDYIKKSSFTDDSFLYDIQII